MAQMDPNVQASPFLQYSYLDSLDIQHRKNIQPRKKQLREAIQSEMQNKNERTRTEDGKHFFVITTKKAKPGLTQTFLSHAYEKFQEQEHPDREPDPHEAQRFVEYVEQCRDKASQEKTKMDHKKSRPPEAFF